MRFYYASQGFHDKIAINKITIVGERTVRLHRSEH